MNADVEKAVEPTHWMDDRGLVVTDEFLRGPRSTSDWRTAYYIPCVKKGKRFVKLEETQP